MDLTKIIGVVLIFLSTVILTFCLFRKNESFFNLRKIIKDHLSIFSNCKSQYFVFYILPLVFSVGLAIIYQAGELFYSNLSIIVSILLSMLLAILSILSGKDYSSISDADQCKKIKAVTQETITAIIFNTLLCIFMLLFGLVMIVISGIKIDLSFINNNIHIVKSVFAGISYYAFSIMLLNLLLIVKRMSKIIEFDFQVKRSDKK